MAELDIAEKRVPQDGRFRLRVRKGRTIDFRVSIMPSMPRRGRGHPHPRQGVA
jgi:type II secretory ATPase GspE/PulE/Tfp pilus assembly ATPase PilB-like protein